MKNSLNELMIAAIDFAKAGGDSTLNHFQKSFELEFKSDNSPVTNADREAETIIRKKINRHFPGHGIIGEEYGSENEESDIVWVLDPIDGTRSFIHGIPFYTTLIGILIKGVPQVGVIYAPALNELVSAATGLGCTFNEKPANVRRCDTLSEATFLTTDVNSFDDLGYREPFEHLKNVTKLHRTWGDAYGHMMVAIGRADIMIDAVLSVWDAAALMPIINEAGGSYSDFQGMNTIQTGNAISTNKVLKNEIVQLFEKYDS